MLIKLTKIRVGGFSLLEVLISLVVVAIGLIAIAKFQGNFLRSGSDAQARSEATHIAQQQVEALKAYTTLAQYDALLSVVDVESEGFVTVTGTNTEYSVTRTVATNTDPDYKNVAVNVAWTDTVGDQQSITLNSLISRSDPSMDGAIAMGQFSTPSPSPSPGASSSPSPSPTLVECNCSGGSTQGYHMGNLEPVGCTDTCCSEYKAHHGGGGHGTAMCTSDGHMHVM